MKKKKVSVPLLLGAALILGGLILTVYSQVRLHLGAQTRQEVITQIRSILPETVPGTPGISQNPAMPSFQINGEDFVGLLEVPGFGCVLPVADTWDTGKLIAFPCRFWGSAYDHSLVIGGADQPGQFDFCDKISLGALVTVTDMTGTQFSYEVSRVDRASQADTRWLLQEDWDLTLYCRDTYSMTYIAVRCTFHANSPSLP